MDVFTRSGAVPPANKVRRLAQSTDNPTFVDAVPNGNCGEISCTLTMASQSDFNGEEEVEYVEESAYGQIVQGEDGQWYVVMEKESPDIELGKLNNVEVVTNNDGSKTLILEDTSKKEGVAKMHTADLSTMKYNIASTEGIYNADKKEDEGVDGENEFNVVEQVIDGDDDAKFPRGLKQRRSRVYGSCRCPDCGQSFVNTARLERHLAVHQIFGSYLCPLCGKTYKYEYNLFYHWRKTCRDMNDLLDLTMRKEMEVNNLRKMVEEIARKKVEIGPLELGISGQQLYRSFERTSTSTTNLIGRRAATCSECGVTTLEAHMPRHAAIHRGEIGVDEKSIGGGYFCELCGLMFREHFNLIKHWRSGCSEIQANLPEFCDIALDDSALKNMVRDLLKKASTGNKNSNRQKVYFDPIILDAANGFKPKENLDHAEKNTNNQTAGTSSQKSNNSTEQVPEIKQRENSARTLLSSSHQGNSTPEADLIDVVNNQQNEFDERWAVDNLDFMDDDEDVPSHLLMMNEDGQIYPTERAGAHNSSIEQDRLSINQAVQCSECYRSFANVARLERHLAGAHCSIGTHHCILCGNRFKYDYNLLYHYRRSCSYTKMWIDPEIREQLDAVGLKKLVRSLASKEIRFSNNGSVAVGGSIMGHRTELGDSVVRRQMMRSVIPSSSSSTIQLPQNVQLAARPGLPEARQCPICSVAFYGASVLNRHMRIAHPHDYEMWEPSVFDERNADNSAGNAGHLHPDEIEQEEGETGNLQSAGNSSVQYDIEPPPQLQAEEPEEDEESADVQQHHHGQVQMERIGHDYGQGHYGQQSVWSGHHHHGGEDEEEERIEVIPSRRVIQTRQRTRSGYKGHEADDPPTYFEVEVEEHHHPAQAYRNVHQVQQIRHPQQTIHAATSAPQQKTTPAVLRRSSRSTYQQHY